MGARRSQLIKVYETVMDSVAAQQRGKGAGRGMPLRTESRNPCTP